MGQQSRKNAALVEHVRIRKAMARQRRRTLRTETRGVSHV